MTDNIRFFVEPDLATSKTHVAAQWRVSKNEQYAVAFLVPYERLEEAKVRALEIVKSRDEKYRRTEGATVQYEEL